MAGYVARTARNELIFSENCRERRGEADYGLGLVGIFGYDLLNKIRKSKNKF